MNISIDELSSVLSNFRDSAKNTQEARFEIRNEFHHRSSLLENDDLQVFARRKDYLSKQLLGKHIVFCADGVPLESREFFLSDIKLVDGKIYIVKSAFRNEYMNDLILGIEVEREYFFYDNIGERFENSLSKFNVYVSSRFFTLRG